MNVNVRLLEDSAEQCLKLAYQCRNKNAERFLRLLAVDLMLAAERQQRASRNAGLAKLRQIAEAAAAEARA